MGYSFQDRERLWIEAGGAPAMAPIAAAISMAENTSGDPNVVSGTNDVGLWQINLDAHPQYSQGWLSDPLNNARAAVAVSNNGGNWSPWTTYKTGAYQKFLSGASGGFNLLSSSSSTCALSVSLPGLPGGIGATTLCMDGPLAVGAMVLGAIVGIVGLVIIAVYTLERTGVGKEVVKTGKTVASVAGPAGKVVSIVG